VAVERIPRQCMLDKGRRDNEKGRRDVVEKGGGRGCRRREHGFGVNECDIWLT